MFHQIKGIICYKTANNFEIRAEKSNRKQCAKQKLKYYETITGDKNPDIKSDRVIIQYY